MRLSSTVALVVALTALGFAFYGSRPNRDSVTAPDPPSTAKPVSLDKPQYEVVNRKTLPNGATLILLRRNYILVGQGDKVVPIGVVGGCSIYSDPKAGITVPLGC